MIKKLKEILERRAFNRNLKIAQTRFARIVSSSRYYQMGRWERRKFMKDVLRAIGYKQIRIQERQKGLSRREVEKVGEALFDATDKIPREGAT